MCIVLIAWATCADAPLVLAANRDEYHGRATLPAAWWSDAPAVFGGRDRLHGGSWLAVDRSGRIAAVTNRREPARGRPGARSRGLLVGDFLRGNLPPADYLARVAEDIARYDAFNLLVGDREGLWILCSNNAAPLPLGAGIHGMSNGDMDSPWPKVTRGRRELQRILSAAPACEPGTRAALLDLLGNGELPPDDELPDTGIGIDWERLLAPVFVQAGDYGTRSSTVVVRDTAGITRVYERSFDRHGRIAGNVEGIVTS